MLNSFFGMGSSSSGKSVESAGHEESSEKRQDRNKIRIGIVGAGPCGLSQLHAFSKFISEQKRKDISITCFDKQAQWGGQWNDEMIPRFDMTGEHPHSAMYKNLWTNEPKECMEYADYSFTEHFGKPTPSFPSREVIYHYMNGRAMKSGMRKCIFFNRAVRWLSYDSKSPHHTKYGNENENNQNSGRFIMQVEDLTTGDTSRHEFDYVIIATGHFSCQNIPYFEGLETFEGPVLHAHDFRDAEMYRGMDVLLIGASYSAEDIALQSMKYGATSVTISCRSDPLGFEWLPGVEEKPLLTKVVGKRVFFQDGSDGYYDAVVLCTGYLHSFPFVDSRLKLKTPNTLCPPGLYEGVAWIENPRIFYLGMQDQIYTFTMFDAQAYWVRDVILGKIQLPSKEVMQELTDAQVTIAKALPASDFSAQIRYQTEYVRRLMEQTDCPKFDIDLIAQHFDQWDKDKLESIVNYRDKAFKSAVDGTMAPIPSLRWIESKDDSVDAFLAYYEREAEL